MAKANRLLVPVGQAAVSGWLLTPSPLQISCSAVSSLPDVAFKINGKKFTVPATAYVIEVSTPRGRGQGWTLQGEGCVCVWGGPGSW